MKNTRILAIPRPANAPRYRLDKMVKYVEKQKKDILDLSELECKMFKIGEPITLYTIQSQKAYEKALETNVLQADPIHVYEEFKKPYEWLIHQMVQRIGHDGTFPIWLWGEKRDLTDEALLAEGTLGVQLEIELTTDLVISSNFEAWHCVLNNDYLTLHDEEEEMSKSLQWSLTKEQTWERIFDKQLLSTSSYWEGEPTLQYTTGSISLQNVKNVEFFKAK